MPQWVDNDNTSTHNKNLHFTILPCSFWAAWKFVRNTTSSKTCVFFCKDKPFTSWPAYIWNWKQWLVKVDGRPSRSRRGVDDSVAARLSATANRLTYCSLNPDLCFLLTAPCPQLQHMLFQSCQDSCFNRKDFVLHFELQAWIFWPGFLTKDTCGVFPEKRLFSCGLANCSQAITGE